MKKVTLKPKPQTASPDEWVSAGSGSAGPGVETKVETSEVAPTANAATLSAEVHSSGDAAAATAVPMKRLTIDIPSELHTRVKMQCAARGRKMADEIRLLLEERFGADAAQ